VFGGAVKWDTATNLAENTENTHPTNVGLLPFNWASFRLAGNLEESH